MKHRTTSFYIEVKEEGEIKVVPHNNTGGYKFMDRKKAKLFLEQVRKANIDSEFRLVVHTTEVTLGAWDND